MAAVEKLSPSFFIAMHHDCLALHLLVHSWNPLPGIRQQRDLQAERQASGGRIASHGCATSASLADVNG